MKAIELRLPGKNPIIIFSHAIVSIVFQEKSDDSERENSVIITISGWPKPYIYESKDDACTLYNRLLHMLEVELLKI